MSPFRTDSRRSTLVAGTGLHAPKQTPALPNPPADATALIRQTAYALGSHSAVVDLQAGSELLVHAVTLGSKGIRACIPTMTSTGDLLRRLTTGEQQSAQSLDVRARQRGVATDQVGCSLGQCHNNSVDMC